MFVERITRYNFNILTEYDKYKKYSEKLGEGWYTDVMGDKIISLVHHVCEEYDDEKGTDKEKLIKADVVSIENEIRHAFNQGYNLGYKNGKSKDKTLTELRRIIELEKLGYTTSSGYYQAIVKVLQIIDNYI